jgi:hypothetical protein
MSANEFKERLQQRPFEPFRIVMSSGDAYDVRHPEMALLVRGGVYVAVPDAQGRLPDVATWCSFLHITAIEPIIASNGRRPRKK